MRTEIYYFTSTGNSLVAARDIAERTSGTWIALRMTKNARRDSRPGGPSWMSLRDRFTLAKRAKWRCAARRTRLYGPIVEYEKRDHHPDVRLAAMVQQVCRN
jgi:hypothetical protein